MALSFWSDKKITLTVSNKSDNNTGISDVIITGSNGILCSKTELGNTDNGIAGNDKTNYNAENKDDTQVTFYTSVADKTKSSATGSISIKIKWQGLDKTADTADDTYSDDHTISDITIKNAVGSVKFNASNDLWITGATVSENTINLKLLLTQDSNFDTASDNNYIYYTSKEGYDYKVYNAPTPDLLTITSGTTGLSVSKKDSTSNSVTLLFAKNDDVSTNGYKDYNVYGSYALNTISTNAKLKAGLFTGKLKNPITNIAFKNAEITIPAQSEYNAEYSISTAWGGKAYSYDTSAIGSALSIATLTQLPNSNNVGVYSIDTTTAGTYNLTVKTTDNSAPSTVSGSTTIYILSIDVDFTAPTAITGLVYNDSEQALLKAGTVTGGTMKYSSDGTNWSTTIPSGKEAQEYTVYWKIDGDASHKDLAPSAIHVTIKLKDVTITAGNASKTYDGTALTTSSSTQSGLLTGHTYTCTVSGSLTNVGTLNTTPSSAVIKNASNVDVTSNYNITYVKGLLTVNSRAITVKANDASKTYDGTALTEGGYTVTSSTKVASNQTITVTNSGTITYAGTATNVLSSVVIKNASGTDVTSNYTITKANGTLTVNKKDITVLGNSLTVTYDGSSHTLSGVTVTSGSIVSTDTISTTNSLAGTLVSESGTYKPTVIIKNASNTDVTSSYNITVNNGTLTINQRATTVTAASDSKTYDGTALTKTSGCSATNLVTGHSASSTNSGSATNYGDAGVNTITKVTIVNTSGTDLTDNYKITKATGKLTINQRAITVTGDNATKVYDTTALTKNTATASNLVSSHHLHSVTMSGSITKVGSVNNVPSNAKIYNGTHGGSESDVTNNYNITYANGSLTVTLATPTITLSGVNADYDGTEHYATATASVDGTLYWSLTTGVTAATGTALKLTANTAANITSIMDDASKNPDFIIYAIFVPTDTQDYTSITEKTISMNINDVSVTLPTANSSSVVYDAGSHACTFTNGIGGSITKYRYSTDNSTWTESTTNPTFSTVGTRYIQAYYTADGNHSGSSWTSSATLIISKKEVKFTSGSASYEYDGSSHTLNSVSLVSGYSLISGHTFSASNSVSATNVSDSKNFTATVVIKDASGNVVTSNYNIASVTTGKLTITAKSITVTGNSSSKMYDGSALTNSNVSVTGTLSSHHLHSVTMSGTITNVGSTNNTPSSAKIYTGTHGGSESDVTSNYSITYKNGTLTVTQRDITFTADNATSSYTGSALTKLTYTISGSGLASTDHVHSFTITGSLTDTGSSSNVPSDFKIYNGTHSGTESNVTSNYKITYANGTLTITSVKSTLTLTGGGTTFTYNNGSEQGIIYLTASVDGTVYYTTNGSTPTTSSSSKTVTAGTKTSFGGRSTAGTTSFKAYLHPSDTTNYTDSSTVSGTITLAKATPTASFNSVSGTYSGSNYTMTAKASVPGKLYVTYNGTTLTADNYSTSAQVTVTISTANTNTTVNTQKNVCSLTYKGYFVPTDTANYNACTATSNTCVITKANSSVTLTGATEKYHGSAALTETYSGGTIYYATSSDNKTYTSYTTTKPSARTEVGITYVKAYVKGDSNHNDSNAYGPVTLTINYATDTSITVTTTPTTYTGEAQIIASATAHGCTYTLGTGTEAAVETWADDNTSISKTAAGTYYIWYKGTADTNHTGSDIATTFYKSVTISKAASTIPTITGNSGDYDSVYSSGLTLKSVSGGAGGTIYYASSTDGTTYGGWTTTKPSRKTVGTTWVKAYTKGDSNHTDSAETSAVKIVVNKSTDASVTVTLTSGNYTGSAVTLATVSDSNKHGITNWYLGFGTNATTGPTSWNAANTALTNIAAGTYYVWYKYDLDGNHSNTNTGTYVGSTVTINKVKATAPTLTATTVSYHNTATLTASGAAGGTVTYYTSTDNSTWTKYGTTAPTRSEVGTTYVKAYTVADSNHTDSSYSSVVQLIVNKTTDASVTVTLTNTTYNGDTKTVASVGTSATHGVTNYYLGFGSSSTTAPTSYNSANTSLTQVAAGTYYVWYKYDLDDNHSNANTGKYYGSVTISKAASTLPTTFTGSSVAYHKTATVTATGYAGGTIYYNTSSDGTTWNGWSTTKPTRTAVGTTYVKAYIKGDSNHNDSSETSVISLIVTQASDAKLTVTLSTKTYNGSTLTIASVTSSDGVKDYYLGVGTSDTVAPTTWETVNTALNRTNAGTYYVWYKFTPDSSHSNTNTGTYVGSVVINKADPSPNPPTISGLTVSYHSTASASFSGTVSGGTLYYKTNTSSPTGTYANETTTVPARASIGTTYVKAYIKGDSNHNNSSDSSYVSLTVNKATDQKINVTKYPRSYTGNAQILATATTEGCTYYLGFGANSTTEPETWVNGSITNTNAGTYYIWYKGAADANHSGDIAATYYDSVEISKVQATKPTISSTAVSYHSTAKLTVTAGTGGTTHYLTCSTINGTYGNDTTTAPTRSAVGTTYVKAYTKGDSNHTDSDKTDAVALTVNKVSDASVTVSLTTRSYTGNAQVIASATSHGCTYYLACGTDGTTAPTDGWVNSSISKTEAGTYYIWYKGDADANHSNNVSATYKDSVVINKVQATKPTISATSTDYDSALTTPAKVSVTTAGTGGTTHYLTCSTINGTYSGDTTTAPTKNTVGTIYVKAYTKGDSNHTDSDKTDAIALTVTTSSDASVTVSLKTGLTYNKSAQVIASATSHGCSSYLLGTGTASAVSTWNTANTSLSATNAGTYYVWYKGTKDSNHSSDVSQAYVGSTVTIAAYGISNCSISLDTTSYTYNGSAKTPTPTVKFGDTTLTKDTDYTVSYSNNTNAGTATCTCTGKGNYTGTISKTFTIGQASSSITLSASSGTLTYPTTSATFTATLSNSVLKMTVSSSNESVCTCSISSGTVTYKWVAADGTATITVSAAATTNYKACSNTFTVTTKKGTLSLSLSGSNPVYGGTSTATLTGNTDSGVVTWSSNLTSYVTVARKGSSPYNSATLTGVKCGTAATITASVAATSKYYAASKTISISTLKATPVITYNPPGDIYADYDGSWFTILISSNVTGIAYYKEDSELTDSNYYTNSDGNVSIDEINSCFDIYTECDVCELTIYIYFVPTDTTNYNNYSDNGTFFEIDPVPANTPTISGSTKTYDDALTSAATVTISGVSGGTAYYSYSTDNKSTWSKWSTTKPTRKTVGTTYVKAYTAGDKNHDDSDETTEVPITVTASTDTSMTVTLYNRTFNMSSLTIASVTASHGLSATYLGTGSSSAVTSWNSAGSDVTATSAGTYYIWYKGTANTSTHSGNIDATYKGEVKISQYDISNCTLTLDPTSYSYNGTAKTPTATVTNGSASLTSIVYYDYIQSSGTQYIDTGVTDSNDLEMIGTVMMTSTTNYFVFASNGSSTVGGIRFFYTGGNFYAGYNANRALNSNCGTVFPVNTQLTFDFSKSTCKVGSTTFTCNTGTTVQSSTLKIFYDASQPTKNAIGRIYSYQIYKAGTLVRDFKPCAYKGVIGLYDTVNSKFYPNAGTGVFTAGTLSSLTADYTVAYTSNTNAGTATCTCTGVGNYTGTISKTFTIAKIAPTITFSSTSGTLTYPTTSSTFTASVTGGGTLSVKSSDTSVCTCSISSGTVTYNWIKAGTATITVTAAASTNYTTGSKTFSVTCVKGTLNPTFTVTAPVFNSTSTISINGNSDSGTVSWSSSQTDYVTVTASTTAPYNSATLKGVKCGTASTITATIAETTHYYSKTITTSVSTLKATPDLAISATTATLTYPTTSGKFTITLSNTEQTLSVTSSNTDTCTCSLSSKTVTYVWKSAGSATITVSVAASTNYNAASKTCTVTTKKGTAGMYFYIVGDATTALTTYSITYNTSVSIVVYNSYSTNAVLTGAGNYTTWTLSSASLYLVTGKLAGGSDTVTATISGSKYYNDESVTLTITCAKANNTITFDNLSYTKTLSTTAISQAITKATATYGTPTYKFKSGTTTTGWTITSTTGVIAANSYDAVPAGTYTLYVIASVAASTNYNEVSTTAEITMIVQKGDCIYGDIYINTLDYIWNNNDYCTLEDLEIDGSWDTELLYEIHDETDYLIDKGSYLVAAGPDEYYDTITDVMPNNLGTFTISLWWAETDFFKQSGYYVYNITISKGRMIFNDSTRLLDYTTYN